MEGNKQSFCSAEQCFEPKPKVIEVFSRFLPLMREWAVPLTAKGDSSLVINKIPAEQILLRRRTTSITENPTYPPEMTQNNSPPSQQKTPVKKQRIQQAVEVPKTTTTPAQATITKSQENLPKQFMFEPWKSFIKTAKDALFFKIKMSFKKLSKHRHHQLTRFFRQVTKAKAFTTESKRHQAAPLAALGPASSGAHLIDLLVSWNSIQTPENIQNKQERNPNTL